MALVTTQKKRKREPPNHSDAPVQCPACHQVVVFTTLSKTKSDFYRKLGLHFRDVCANRKRWTDNYLMSLPEHTYWTLGFVERPINSNAVGRLLHLVASRENKCVDPSEHLALLADGQRALVQYRLKIMQELDEKRGAPWYTTQHPITRWSVLYLFCATNFVAVLSQPKPDTPLRFAHVFEKWREWQHRRPPWYKANKARHAFLHDDKILRQYTADSSVWTTGISLSHQAEVKETQEVGSPRGRFQPALQMPAHYTAAHKLSTFAKSVGVQVYKTRNEIEQKQTEMDVERLESLAPHRTFQTLYVAPQPMFRCDDDSTVYHDRCSIEWNWDKRQDSDMFRWIAASFQTAYRSYHVSC